MSSTAPRSGPTHVVYDPTWTPSRAQRRAINHPAPSDALGVARSGLGHGLAGLAISVMALGGTVDVEDPAQSAPPMPFLDLAYRCTRTSLVIGAAAALLWSATCAVGLLVARRRTAVAATLREHRLEVDEQVAKAHERAMTIDEDWSPTAQALWAQHCQAMVWDIACRTREANNAEAAAQRLAGLTTTTEDRDPRLVARAAELEAAAQQHRAVAHKLLDGWNDVMDTTAAELRRATELAAQDDAYVSLVLGEPVIPSDAVLAIAEADTVAFFDEVADRARATRAAWSELGSLS